MFTKIVGWFTGGATSLLPWAVVFGFGLVVGAAPVYKIMDWRYDSYKGTVAEAKLKAVTEAYAKGTAAGKKAEATRAELEAKQEKTAASKRIADEEIKNAKKSNPKFTARECAWPDSLRDAYNAIGSGSVPRRNQGNTPVPKKNGS